MPVIDSRHITVLERVTMKSEIHAFVASLIGILKEEYLASNNRGLVVVRRLTAGMSADEQTKVRTMAERYQFKSTGQETLEYFLEVVARHVYKQTVAEFLVSAQSEGIEKLLSQLANKLGVNLVYNDKYVTQFNYSCPTICIGTKHQGHLNFASFPHRLTLAEREALEKNAYDAHLPSPDFVKHQALQLPFLSDKSPQKKFLSTHLPIATQGYFAMKPHSMISWCVESYREQYESNSLLRQDSCNLLRVEEIVAAIIRFIKSARQAAKPLSIILLQNVFFDVGMLQEKLKDEGFALQTYSDDGFVTIYNTAVLKLNQASTLNRIQTAEFQQVSNGRGLIVKNINTELSDDAINAHLSDIKGRDVVMGGNFHRPYLPPGARAGESIISSVCTLSEDIHGISQGCGFSEGFFWGHEENKKTVVLQPEHAILNPESGSIRRTGLSLNQYSPAYQKEILRQRPVIGVTTYVNAPGELFAHGKVVISANAIGQRMTMLQKSNPFDAKEHAHMEKIFTLLEKKTIIKTDLDTIEGEQGSIYSRYSATDATVLTRALLSFDIKATQKLPQNDNTQKAILIHKLMAYINRIDSHRSYGTTTPDFSFGFLIMKNSRAANREVNYYLAKDLLRQLITSSEDQSVKDVLSTVDVQRSNIIKGTLFEQRHKGRGINSSDLKEVIKLANKMPAMR